MRITVAVAALVLATACSSNDPAPAPLPTPSPTAAPTTAPPPTTPPPSPTPTAPTLPPAARADTPAGAESFARFWIQALDYASTSGDTSVIREVADCTGCNALADGIDRLRQAGGRTIGGQVSISASDTVRHVPGQAALVDLTYSRAPRTVTEGSGASRAVPAERNVRLLVTLKRVGESWLISNAQPTR